MKKILSVLIALLLIVPAYAVADCGCDNCVSCECSRNTETVIQSNSSVLIAKSETTVQSGIYIGEAWFALTSENRVIGKISPFENQPILPACPPQKPYIGGCMDNGLIREKGSMTTMTDLNGAVFGLKSVHVSIQIQQEHIGLVESIVHSRLEVDEITANSIIAASMWWQKNTVCHIFFLPSASRVWVGTVTVNNGKAIIGLYAGDFNGDGIPEIGFTAGSCPKSEPTPEPVPDPAPAPKAENTETRKVCQKTVCVRNYYTTNIIQINNQVNINSKVTNVQNVNVPCGKGVKCVTMDK